MTIYIPPLEHVDQSWYIDWSESVGFSKFENRVLTNSRLSHKIYERLIDRVGIDKSATLPESEALYLKVLGAEKSRLQRLCGLLIHRRYVASLVTRDELSKLLRYFSVADLLSVLNIESFEPPVCRFEIDADRIFQLVQTTGGHCLQVWTRQMSDESKKRAFLICGTTQPKEYYTSIDYETAALVINLVCSNVYNKV